VNAVTLCWSLTRPSLVNQAPGVVDDRKLVRPSLVVSRVAFSVEEDKVSVRGRIRSKSSAARMRCRIAFAPRLTGRYLLCRIHLYSSTRSLRLPPEAIKH